MEQPATTSGVALWGALGAPGMSPTSPKSAKYRVPHGSNRLPGLEKCSPLVIGSAVVGWLSLCCAVLAPDIVFRGDHVLPLLCYRGVPLAHNLSIYCRFR